MAAPSPCCPPGAEPLLEGTTYVPKGEMIVVSGKDCYVARPTRGDPDNAVLMFHDGLGWPSGRCKEIADDLAIAGYLVLMPHFHDGFTGSDPGIEFGCKFYCQALTKLPGLLCCGGLRKFRTDTDWATIIQPYVLGYAVPWLRSQSPTKSLKIAAIGFCWGTYQVFRCCASPEFVCGVNFHMSVDKVASMNKENDMDVCKAVKVPQLMVVCSGDGRPYFPDGAAANEVIKAAPGSVVLETPQKHGFFNRGDPAIPEKREALQRFHTEMINFMNAQMS